jgi:hypothetical protein
MSGPTCSCRSLKLWCRSAAIPAFGGNATMAGNRKQYPPPSQSQIKRPVVGWGAYCLLVTASQASKFNFLSAFQKRRLICQSDSQCMVLNICVSRSPLEMEACPVVFKSRGKNSLHMSSVTSKLPKLEPQYGSIQFYPTEALGKFQTVR